MSHAPEYSSTGNQQHVLKGFQYQEGLELGTNRLYVRMHFGFISHELFGLLVLFPGEVRVWFSSVDVVICVS